MSRKKEFEGVSFLSVWVDEEVELWHWFLMLKAIPILTIGVMANFFNGAKWTQNRRACATAQNTQWRLPIIKDVLQSCKPFFLVVKCLQKERIILRMLITRGRRGTGWKRGIGLPWFHGNKTSKISLGLQFTIEFDQSLLGYYEARNFALASSHFLWGPTWVARRWPCDFGLVRFAVYNPGPWLMMRLFSPYAFEVLGELALLRS